MACLLRGDCNVQSMKRYVTSVGRQAILKPYAGQEATFGQWLLLTVMRNPSYGDTFIEGWFHQDYHKQQIWYTGRLIYNQEMLVLSHHIRSPVLDFSDSSCPKSNVSECTELLQGLVIFPSAANLGCSQERVYCATII